MSDIIDLTAERERREQPSADFTRRDDFGRIMFAYSCSYEFDGGTWDIKLWAYSMDDAQARVGAMRESLALQGQIYAEIAG